MNPTLPRFIPRIGISRGAAIWVDHNIVPSPPRVIINAIPSGISGYWSLYAGTIQVSSSRLRIDFSAAIRPPALEDSGLNIIPTAFAAIIRLSYPSYSIYMSVTYGLNMETTELLKSNNG